MATELDQKDQESVELIEKFEGMKPGVAELSALYDRIESVYLGASQAGQEYPIIITNSTNSR